MKKSLHVLCTVIVAIVFSGCEKEGSMGPEGKQGEQGPPGIANVVSSEWIPAKVWDRTLGNSEKTAFYTVSQEALNAVGEASLKSFLDNGGTFLVYLRRESKYYHLLPSTYGISVTCDWALDGANPKQYVLNVIHRTGGVIPDALGDHTKLSLRYVMIPAGRTVQAVATAEIYNDIRDMTYDEVKALFSWEN